MKNLSFEQIWDAILSREESKIRAVYAHLDADSKNSIAAHLKRMTCEDGWHPEQVISARFALEVLEGKE